MIIDTECSQRL